MNSAAARLVPAALVAALAVALACAPPAAAQTPACTAADATAPEKTRPRIGVVLSGGGARGLAHVGVLKVLHEMRIPIDCIAGTSMGAIVAGLYASGMKPDEMQRRLNAVEWPQLLSDDPPRPDRAYRRKEEETAFPLGLELGIRDGKIQWFKGALSGSNLEQFLHEMTRNVDAVEDFDRLPVPYRAVATNMITGKEVVFDRGRLYQAMRASMSVPGMFAPTELDGRILGDGGLVNNLPVDAVRAMGADIVIAVNIGTPLMTRDELQSVFGYATQMLNILTEQNVRAHLAQLTDRDILISPDLGTLTFLDFTQGPKFVEFGIRAAEEVRPQLVALSAAPPQFAQYERRFIVPPEPLPEKLDFVTVEGTKFANPEVLEEQMQTQPGRPFQLNVLERDVARIAGRGDFEQVDYELVRVGREKGAIVGVTEKSWGPNFLRFGMSLSTDLQGETLFDLMVGHRRVWLNSLGAEWTNELVLGTTRRYATEFYQPLTPANLVFASAYGGIERAPQFAFYRDQRVAEYDVLTEVAGFDFGVPIGTRGELRAGYQWSHQRAGVAVGLDAPTIRTDESGLRLLARWDTLDNPFFPRNGLRVNAEAVFGSRKTSITATSITPDLTADAEQTSRASLFANAGYPLWKDGFVNVAVRAGGLTKTKVNDPINDFNLGGFLNVSGLRTDQLAGNYVGFGRVVYYHQLGNLPLMGRGYYVGGSFEAGNTWFTREQASFTGMYTAGSVFFAADTWVGPFYVAWGRASGGQSSFYIYLGRI